ncbi:MAG: hypothetical protein WCL23_05940, partial [Candidatus Moraniibacteriota bacterium]
MVEGKYKKYLRISLCTGILSILGLISFSHLAYAATGINAQINFQGKVVNTDGTNVTNGNYNMIFRAYTASSGGTAAWTETWNTGTAQVTVTDGVFQVALGTYAALPGSLDFDTDNIYLTVEFNGNGEMSPRIRFTAVPYAFNAKKVSGLTVTDTTGTLTIANTKTVSFSDAFTTSGAFPMTLAATASTSVTLPTSGTLATLAGAEALSGKTYNGLSLSSAADGFTVAGGTTSRTLTISGGNVSINQNLTTTSSPSFTGISVSGLTTGSVVYAGSSGALSQDNSNFFWDGTNHRLGIGTTSPAGILDVRGGTATSGNGTSINVYAQNGATSGVTNGGNIILMPGTANVTGTSGHVGVGTTSPGATLTSIGTGYTAWAGDSN